MSMILEWYEMIQRNKLNHEKKRWKVSWLIVIHKTRSVAPSQKSHLLLIPTFFLLAPTIVECSVIPAYFAQITY